MFSTGPSICVCGARTGAFSYRLAVDFCTILAVQTS